MRLLAIDAHKTISYCIFEDGTPIVTRTFKDVTPATVCDVFRTGKFQGPIYTLGMRGMEVVIEVPDAWTRDGKNMRAIMNINAIAYSLGNLFAHQDIPVHYKPVSEWKERKTKHTTNWETVVALKAQGIDYGLAKNEHERDALALGLWWLRHGVDDRISRTVAEGGGHG